MVPESVKHTLLLALVAIPSLVVLVVITAIIADASPGPSQLYWKWGKLTEQDLGFYHNGSLSGSPASFSFTGGGASCTGSSSLGGQATLDCSGPGWSWHARGGLYKRAGGFMFNGSGNGWHGDVNDFVEYISLGAVG